ncbi:hypothetical protein GCM10022215_22660 [Nocardioides fonticola]|uniref:Lipoprotein n=1 Tax=Nocardioides fonticola TaxID=450363 RepID=A0ABP7XK50_9ACTN
MPTRVPALVILLLALGTAGLTGCGGDSDASADPPAPASTSTTPTVEPTPTTAPPQAPPGETARQFVYRWNETEEAMQNTGDIAAYRALTSQCAPCDDLARRVSQAYAAGGSIDYQGMEITAVKVVPSDPKFVVVEVTGRLGTTDYQPKEGSAVQHFDGGLRKYQLTLIKRDGWKLRNLFGLPL